MWLFITSHAYPSSILVSVYFSIPVFTKFVWENNGSIKFVILVEDSDIGIPNLVTTVMEYWFALQFLCCELSVRNQWGGKQGALLLFFVIWECFDRPWIRVGGGAGQNVLFAFSFLLLPKEMKTRGQSKILSCCFGVNQNNSEAGWIQDCPV